MSVNALRGCTKKWIDVLTGDGMLGELDSVLDRTESRQRIPDLRDMFTFARHSLTDARVVILAMDPHEYQPHGLAFSSRGARAPSSLAGVWHTLLLNGLIRSAPELAELAEPHNLSHWAAQGIVLLNCALTAEPNKPGSHVELWRRWSDRMLSRLSLAMAPGVIWCLWGVDAQRKAPLIDARHEILTSCYPTEAAFETCDHFQHITTRWPGICWDPRDTETHYFTDCSARNNQSKTCRAAWGVVCTRGLMNGRSWGAETVTSMILQKGEKTPSEARPTNIRAEGQALIQALKLAMSLPRTTPVKIHTDSKFWIDMLIRYIPDWMDRGAKFTSKANSDISSVMWSMYEKLGENTSLVFVRAWHDRARPKDDTDDLTWWLGNRAAERRAEAVLGL